MKINDDGSVSVTEDDEWAVLVRHVGSQRVTVVGPYPRGHGGVNRAREDARAWSQEYEVRTLVCRMMHPADMERALLEEDDDLFGYSANMRKGYNGLLHDEKYVEVEDESH